MVNYDCEYFKNVCDYIVSCEKNKEVIHDRNYCNGCEHSNGEKNDKK
jgi:hypothetical protein